MEIKMKQNGFSGSELDPMIEMVIRAIVKRVAHRAMNECMDMVRELMAQRQEKGTPMQQLTRAVGEGSHLFWAASAWAVVYGVARDVCGYKGTVSDFERNASRLKMPDNFDYPCTCNKVNRTICDHAYMRLHVNKWKEYGASDRELALLEFLMARIEK